MKPALTEPRSPELALVVLCARRNVEEPQREQLRELLAGPIDWSRVFAEALWHGTIPLLVRHLTSMSPHGCPDEIWQDLRAHAVGAAAGAARLLRELRDVAETLESAGIPVVALKGPILSCIALGDPSLRMSTDLDVLVRRDDVLRAVAKIEALGYRFWGERRSRKLLEDVLQTDYEFPFERAASGVRLDLHWGVYHAHYRLGARGDDLWQRTEFVAAANGRYRVFGRQDQVLYLATHAAKHDWAQLRWLVDIVELLRSDPDLAAEATKIAGASWNGARIWRTTLRLGVDWLDLEAPASLMAAIEADPVAMAVAEQVGRRWNAGAPSQVPPAVPPWRSLYYQVVDHSGDRFRMIYDFFARPRITDFEFLRVPLPLRPLYFLIRPVRAFAVRCRQAFARKFRNS